MPNESRERFHRTIWDALGGPQHCRVPSPASHLAAIIMGGATPRGDGTSFLAPADPTLLVPLERARTPARTAAQVATPRRRTFNGFICTVVLDDQEGWMLAETWVQASLLSPA